MVAFLLIGQVLFRDFFLFFISFFSITLATAFQPGSLVRLPGNGILPDPLQ
jgi:hypothetical protein